MRRLRPGVPGRRHHTGRCPPWRRIMTAEGTIHISSAVVSVLPKHRDEVLRMLAALPEVETHQSTASKIVIVMEAAESGIMGGRRAEISSWQGVLSANVVFEQVEHLERFADSGD